MEKETMSKTLWFPELAEHGVYRVERRVDFFSNLCREKAGQRKFTPSTDLGCPFSSYLGAR